MSFTRPDLQSIIDRVKGDIRNALQITSILRRSTEEAFSVAIGGASHVLHGHMRFISQQLFPTTAIVQFLEKWAAVYAIQRNPKTFANLQLTGTGTDGSTIPALTVYQRDDGFTYETDAGVTIAGGVYTVAVTALAAGATGNLDDGEGVTLVSPISGVNSGALVDSTNTEAEDEETDDSLRARVLARIRTPPSGGTVTDYLTYALEVPGVTRAWVLPNHNSAGFFGEGGVAVSFVEDGESPIIPSAAKVTEVQTSVDLQKPVTADAVVFAPVANTIPMTINLKPNTALVRAAVTAELEDLFAREGQVAGAVDPDLIAAAVTFDGGLSLSKINEAISVAAGEQDHVLVTPAANVVSSTGQIIILGTLTFGTLA